MTTQSGGPISPPAHEPVWTRPRSLGYHEALRGLGGIVSPLLAGFSLAGIATLTTAEHPPRLADWSISLLAGAVALLLFSMQVAFMSLTRNATPQDILAWHPEITVSETELYSARQAQGEAFRDMSRLGRISLFTYNLGLIAFLLGVLLLLIPRHWTAGYGIGLAAIGVALFVEIWWIAANHWRNLPHPVAKPIVHSHLAGWAAAPPQLDAVGYAAILDVGKREAAGYGRALPADHVTAAALETSGGQTEPDHKSEMASKVAVNGSVLMKPKLSSVAWRLGISAVLPIVGLVAGVIGLTKFWHQGNSHGYPWAALVVASGGMLLLIVVFDVVARSASPPNRKAYGWVNVVLGADGRISTSKTQIWLWTFGIGAALLYLSGIVIFRIGHDADVFTKTGWTDYLVLLGGPFAAGVLAQFTVTTKLDSGTLQKAPTVAAAAAGAAVAPAGTPKALDVIANDAGELDLVDSQYFIFNLVAFIYVAGLFVSQIIDKQVTDIGVKYALPSVPSVLLGLTSISAATYVANKAAVKNAPLISSVSPQPVVAGQNVDILGVNLVPVGADPTTVPQSTSVVIHDTANAAADTVLAPISASATKVTFLMPAVYKGKAVTLQVITTSNVATPPLPISVT